MAQKPTPEELKKKITLLEKDLRDCKAAEEALKDYTAYQSVLAELRGLNPDTSEDTLLQTLLSEIVARYGFYMAWYGQYSHDQITPRFSAGKVDKYLDGLILKIKEPHSPDAYCAMSHAILKEKPFSYKDLENDEGFLTWRDYALELGYRSNLALPFIVDGQVEGGIMVYADRPRAFPDERIERLELLTTETAAIMNQWRLKALAEKALGEAYDILEKQVAERTADISKTNVRLTQEIEAHKQAQEALQESESKYSTLVEQANVGVVILQKETFQYANKAFSALTGYTFEELQGMHFLDVVAPDHQPLVAERYEARKAGTDVPFSYEFEALCKGGTKKVVELSVSKIQFQGGSAFMGVVTDITARREKELALRKKDAELEIKTKNLEEVNTALKVLLRERQRDKTALEEKVLSNIKELVVPYLERLKRTSLDDTQLSCVDVLETNLKEIISPFSKKLSSKYLGLTPTEIQVANLVKDGKTTKEIAEFMNLSAKTVEFHRDNIRKKLGIKNRRINLRTHLLSM